MTKQQISSRSWVDLVFAYMFLVLCIMMVKYLDQPSLQAVITILGAALISFDNVKPVNEWPRLYQIVYHRIQILREKTRIGASRVGNSVTHRGLNASGRQPGLFDTFVSLAPRSKKRRSKTQTSRSTSVSNNPQLSLRLPRLISEIDIEVDGDLYTTDELTVIRYTQKLGGEPPEFTTAFFDEPECVQHFIINKIRAMYLAEKSELDGATMAQLEALARVVKARHAKLSKGKSDEFISNGLSLNRAAARKIRTGRYTPLIRKFALLKPQEWGIW